MGDLPPPRLRGVKKDDLPRIAELEKTAFGPKGLSRNGLDVMFDPSGELWILAEDDEGIWGYSVNLRTADSTVGWIAGMAIHPARQRHGWGQLLLRATIDRLHDYDMKVIRLLVKPTNKLARRLYENSGFIDTGERVDHFGPGQSRMVMSLLLPTRGDWHQEHLPEVPVDPDAFTVTDGTTSE
ncbi:GNAT family N-acetyltransferase [Catenulispora rubra]|uniref:GNAT family N-acetyltransferase n=1 Tax=Catenulispora rubra TaxID=280293 RepID=UPI001892526F|nr:N-acetyltransferase [Catenulispora rubra]